jgi:hypothetical protein
MVAILNVIGVIALVVGVILWFAMLQSGLANMRQEQSAGSDQVKAPPSGPSESRRQ